MSEETVSRNPIPDYLVWILIVGLFLHGNWEYSNFLSKVERAEVILETYSLKIDNVVNRTNRGALSYEQAMTEIEQLSSEYYLEFNREADKLSSALDAPWNRSTAENRRLIADHWDAWKSELRRRSLSDYSPTGSQINKTFKEACDAMKTKRSWLSWPYAYFGSAKQRVEDICES